MDKKSVQERKDQLDKTAVIMKQQIEKLRNDLNATVGASQDCDHWLKELEKQESEKPVEE